MKAFNVAFCLIFIVFAGLQYNDPDPYVWMPIYLYAAVLCWMFARGKYYPNAYLAGILVYGVYAIFKIFEQDGLIDWIKYHHASNIAETMKAEHPWIEESREFFGLLILIFVLALDYFFAPKHREKKRSSRR